MKKVFVTGGAGFIGSHLVKQLLADGKEVTVYDDLIGASKTKNRLGYLVKHPRFKFVRGNIFDYTTLVWAMRGYDTVIHLAANCDIPSGVDNPNLDFESNIVGTHNVLGAMRQLDIQTLLFSSTAAVYGDNPNIVHTESEGPLYPISHYGASKLACEALISGYSHSYYIKSFIFRFGNVVGSGMDHGVIHDFIMKLNRNPNVLEVWGDGNGYKPFFMVGDCVWGMMAAYNASNDTNGNTKLCDVFNLGTDTTTKISEVAETVISLMGLSDVEVRYTGSRHGFKGDVPVVLYSAKKMNAIGWKPRFSSNEAVDLATSQLIQELR